MINNQQDFTMQCALMYACPQDVPIATVTAGVGHTVFIDRCGQGYWCGEGMGKPVSNTHTQSPVI